LIDAFLLAFSLWVAFALDRWSLGLDFKILLRTIPAVILGLGRNKSVLYIEIEQQFGRPAPDQPWGA
jgi:hypothetical protein